MAALLRQGPRAPRISERVDDGSGDRRGGAIPGRNGVHVPGHQNHLPRDGRAGAPRRARVCRRRREEGRPRDRLPPQLPAGRALLLWTEPDRRGGHDDPSALERGRDRLLSARFRLPGRRHARPVLRQVPGGHAGAAARAAHRRHGGRRALAVAARRVLAHTGPQAQGAGADAAGAEMARVLAARRRV